MSQKRVFRGVVLASPVGAEIYFGRCKMGECLHYDRSNGRVAGKRSARVRGAIIRVTLRQAVSDRPDKPRNASNSTPLPRRGSLAEPPARRLACRTAAIRVSISARSLEPRATEGWLNPMATDVWQHAQVSLSFLFLRVACCNDEKN